MQLMAYVGFLSEELPLESHIGHRKCVVGVVVSFEKCQNSLSESGRYAHQTVFMLIGTSFQPQFLHYHWSSNCGKTMIGFARYRSQVMLEWREGARQEWRKWAEEKGGDKQIRVERTMYPAASVLNNIAINLFLSSSNRLHRKWQVTQTLSCRNAFFPSRSFFFSVQIPNIFECSRAFKNIWNLHRNMYRVSDDSGAIQEDRISINITKAFVCNWKPFAIQTKKRTWIRAVFCLKALRRNVTMK